MEYFGIIVAYDEELFSTGGYVNLDHCFCVLKGLIQLRNKSIFYCDIINNRRYWNSVVPGKYMEDHFVG